MKRWAWKFTVQSSVLGACGLAFATFGPFSAVQQAAVAAISIGLAVVPYCYARALSELQDRD